MAFSYACVTLQRFVLPLVLVLAALVRPIGISFVYLLMFFISPFIPVATAQNFKGSVTAYLIILISLSTLLLLGHIGLQVAILALDLESIFGSCSFTEQLLRHIGFIDLFKLQLYAIIEWLVPEVVVFCTSIAIYVVIKNITTETSDVASQAELGEGLNLTEDVAADVAPTTSVVPRPKPKKSSRPLIQINFDPLVKIAPMFCLATLFFSAVLRPSVPGGFYFMFFLLSGTYWATFQSLKRGFAILIRFVMVVLVLHTLSIVSYQTPWVQQNLDNSTLPARLVGLEPLITSTCAKDIRYLNYDTTFKLDSFLSPIVMLFSYYVLALTSKNIINMRMSNPSNHRKSEPTETTPLVRHKKSIPIERNIESIRTESDIPMDLLDNGVDVEKGPSVFDQISYGIVSVGGFIYQNSYIFTNILMMAWSIVYHSWLTFVFLLWANVLWMIPNQRKAMMRSSPFIVLYAELLLIAQYIYGMNLTNDELPSSVNTTGINLQQIGLERPSENNVQPCVPLITKTSFLLMFWVTLRQFFKEKNERKRHSTLADMVAPLQVTVGTATADLGATQESKKTSKFLKKAGDIIKNLLVRLWIWLLILVIFLCAITGVKMTGFRICYMAMFLFFLLVFQSSSKAWVKIMYGFWLFLIFYAMSILTLIYTYQFDKFDEYWDHYLNISKTLQEDIGLKKYETKDLFLHLVSPTIIVILTVIQVHYFHRRFIAALQQQATESKSAPRAAVESEPADTSLRESSHLRDYRTSFTEESGFQESLKDLFRRLLTIIKKRSKYMAKHFKGVCWRFLELHLIKAVYISAFVCCVSEVCVLHIPFCLLCIVGLVSRNKIQIFISRIISLSVSVIILTKMIYQVQYISHDKYNVVCNSTGTTENNAVWFGLQKATVNGGLMDLIKKYIIFMVMVTLHAVVTLRQNQMRHIQGDHSQRGPPILFPSVTRADAEKNLEGLIQYLFNYGFYKFGMECTLICLVALISYRQDIVALLYVVWLCGILWLPRRSCARIWGFFQCFTATIIFLEYIVLVGIPPGLCIEYPWLNSIYSNPLQKWAMLPGDLNYSHVKKLIFDFIMLLFISRQKRVFASELQIVDNNFPGGTNASVIKDIEQLGQVPFVNPTRDFLSTIRNYLDVIKNGVLCGFFWVTLSVVFVAGTNISDLLAVGYLIGAFVFLWEGSDFYLRPIRVILRRWNLLLLFNVFNIALKTFLQIGGCLFMKNLKHHACWLIHMLGITCALDVDSMLDTDDNDCPGLRTQSYLVWDATCFAFIVLQLRIFQSHYFCHIINDMKANALLAYRGAEIIEDLRQKQIEHRRKHEQEVLRKIKRKMEKIRATQQKMLRPIDKPTHFDEHGFPIPGYRAYRRKDHTTHVQAIRAGDYYMFDDMDEKFELDLIDDEVDFLEQEGKIDESEKKMTRRKNLFEHEKFEKPKTGHKSEAPSTSKGEVHEEQEDTEKKDEADSAEETEKESSREIDPPNPILRLLEGFMVSVVIRLNRFSRNYRYVMKILAEEKKALKESKKFASDSGIFNVNVSTPVPIMKKQLISDDEASITIAQQTSQSNTEIHDTTTDTTTTTAVLNEPLVDLNEIQLDTTDAPIRKDSDSIASLSKHTGPADFSYEEEDFASRDHHIIIEAIISSYYAVLANTDLICYIVVFINQVINASLISLPLPLMVFLWGTLSLPRPTKTFWITLIAYTQALIVIKCIFQFKLIWANYINLPNQPLSAAKIIGVALDKHFANYDLLLLLVLFVHRFGLKSQGLWKSEYKGEVMQEQAMREDNDKIQNDESAIVLAEDSSLSVAKVDEYQTTDSNSNESEEYMPGISTLTKNKYAASCKKFFKNLIHKTRLPADVYALMFMCDFINFFVLLFGFTAFGSQHGEGGVQTYLVENKVPIPFLIMLLVQFILIVIDRALYLRKALVHKIIFHFFSVIGIHIWMFFVIPAVTERSFYSLAPPIIFYIIKCFYLLLSAYQIKCGYPKRILGNFLTKGFSMMNMISFRCYMQIPFLYELRTILDWVCTDTTMTLFDWLKMEDIFSDIYFIKCGRQMEEDFPAMRGEKKAMFSKIMMGGCIIFLIVVSIWGPLCLFALGNAVGQPNLPYEVTASVRIGPYDPIYDTNNRESIFSFDATMFQSLQNAYKKDRLATLFLTNYDESDIAAIVLKANAPSMWGISPPDKERLLDDLIAGRPLICRFRYSFTRIPPVKNGVGTISDEVTHEFNETFVGREDMIAMLQGTAKNNTVVVIPFILPKFLKVHNSGELNAINQLMPNQEVHRPLGITLHTSQNASDGVWWEINDICDDPFYKQTLSKLPYSNCSTGVVMYTFNDKKFPSTFSFLTAGGIIGLYTTFVLLASRVLKSFICDQNGRIMYEDLPYVDRVLQLCLDIYLVREALEFALEEDLFAKLLFLYRSPETMIKWTRPKEETVDDETDTESLRSKVSHRRLE